VEGPTDDPAIAEARTRIKRAMLATVMTAMGTPMLLAGDEFGRTQQGNNNAYCQDDEISWIDWSLADSAEGKALQAFTARLIALRRRYPIIHSRKFLYGQTELAPGLLDIAWFDERGLHLSGEDWNNPEGRALTMRRAELSADGSITGVSVLLNASESALTFHLPPPDAQRRVLIDSADPEAPERDLSENTIEVRGYSAVVLIGVIPAPAS
jgi:isoamylase